MGVTPHPVDRLAGKPLERLRADVRDRRFNAALAQATSMLEAGEVSPSVWALRGKALEGLKRSDEALANYRRGLTESGADARLHLLAGHCYSRQCEARNAIHHFRQALRLSPGLLDAYRGLLNFEAVDPDSSEAASILAVALSDARGVMERARACFLMGQIFVDAGRDHSGFTFYRSANRSIGRGLPGKQRHFTVPDAALAIRARHFAAADKRRAESNQCTAILVAGLPRSGKSLVESILCRSQDVFPGGELAFVRHFVSGLEAAGEIDSLADRLRDPTRHANLSSGLARRYRDFAQRMRPHDPPRFVTDTSPANLRRIGYLSLVQPEVPIIFCRRDPLDLAVALYFKHFGTGHGYSYSLSATGRAIARAEKLMDHWLQNLPNPMATVRYEDMARDPSTTHQKLCEFLGLAAAPGSRPTVNTGGKADGGPPAEWRLFTSRSIDGHGEVRPDLIGFGKRFEKHMQSAMRSYEEEYANTARP